MTPGVTGGRARPGRRASSTSAPLPPPPCPFHCPSVVHACAAAWWGPAASDPLSRQQRGQGTASLSLGGRREGMAAQLALGEKLHTRWEEGGSAVVAQSFRGEEIDCCVSLIRQETPPFNLQALTDSRASVCVCVRVCHGRPPLEEKKRSMFVWIWTPLLQEGEKMDVQQIKWFIRLPRRTPGCLQGGRQMER